MEPARRERLEVWSREAQSRCGPSEGHALCSFLRATTKPANRRIDRFHRIQSSTLKATSSPAHRANAEQ